MNKNKVSNFASIDKSQIEIFRTLLTTASISVRQLLFFPAKLAKG